MSIRTSPWPPGVPCWVDLTVPDVDTATSFYASVLGWTFSDEDDTGYRIALVDGAAAAGVGPPPQPGVPTCWTTYLATDDVVKTSEAVGEHGGTVLLPAADVGESGRVAVVADPTGAAFGLWQARAHIGAGVVNRPGALVWEDLRTPDPDTARAFYGAVFGYRFEALDMAGPDYSTFALPDDPAPLGGMGSMMGAEDQPPHWLVYFGVADLGAAVAAADRAGGSAVVPAFPSPFGAMAGLADPAGAVFWLVESDDSVLPTAPADRSDWSLRPIGSGRSFRPIVRPIAQAVAASATAGVCS